jgi:hypothetical protein
MYLHIYNEAQPKSWDSIITQVNIDHELFYFVNTVKMSKPNLLKFNLKRLERSMLLLFSDNLAHVLDF